MKHEMTLFHTMGSNRNVYSRHPFFLWPCKVLCGDLQQDDAGPFERSLLTSTHFILLWRRSIFYSQKWHWVWIVQRLVSLISMKLLQNKQRKSSHPNLVLDPEFPQLWRYRKRPTQRWIHCQRIIQTQLNLRNVFIFVQRSTVHTRKTSAPFPVWNYLASN